MSSFPIFRRLVGLETEYAPRIPRLDGRPRPSRFRFYSSVLDAVSRRVPTVAASHLKEGRFTANGGAVWFESASISIDTGLIEGSTPECRGPRQILAYQRAQDRLLGEAAQQAAPGAALVKNDRDAQGNIYGAQENYEAEVAADAGLWLWRAGLAALFPFALLTWLSFVVMIVGIIAYFTLAGLVYLIASIFANPRRVARVLFGQNLLSGDRWMAPGWLGGVLHAIERFVTSPLAIGVYLLARCAAFRRTRRDLLPFLVSRQIFCGAGMLDDEGEFLLADKAPGINCIVGFGGFVGERAVFSYGHFLKALYAEACFSPAAYIELFRGRQRLQIALGDSNMCQTAEYLRVGTTLLVLDAIEGGAISSPPAVRRPIRTLHRICREGVDCRVNVRGGGTMTPLEIQRWYYDACRVFVERHPDPPEEAWDVLHRWEQVLDELERRPDGLVGVLDWVTKRFLLKEAGEGASWEAKKKIDVRYHELSPEGYFERLRSTGLIEELLDEREIERAVRSPPPDSPATTRGRYIREFAEGDKPVRANWRYVYIGRGRGARAVLLRGSSRTGSPPDQAT